MPVINPSLVIPVAYSNFGVRKMKKVLEKQGQIEPLQIRQVNDGYLTFEQDAWGGDIVMAARELGWDCILIVLMDKYEE